MTGEKTEQPTSKKLRDARQKGQVAQSKDVTSTALLIAVFAFFMIWWSRLVAELQEFIVFPATLYTTPFEDALPTLWAAVVDVIVRVTAPVLGMVFVIGIMAGYFQVGALFVMEPVKPDLKKLNPVDKLKQIFSMKNFIEFIKSVLKVLFLSILLYLVIVDALPTLVLMPYAGLEGIKKVLGSLMFQVAIYTSFAYSAVAAADFGFQRWQHTKQLMMTKDEIKREYKEMEGDPTIKSKRKQLHQEMVMNDNVQNTRQSTVLVTNPTHRAIAIYYKQGETKLPKVTAKGEGYMAKRMIEVAQEEGIPIMQNVPLAHDLFDNGALDQYIPRDLIEPVAEVLRWVQQLVDSRELS